MHLQPGSAFNKITLLGLNALSTIYKTVALIAFLLKSMNRKKYPPLVISVDNLSFGGTGKTPMVIEIARFLEGLDIKFAIILRGYRSRYQKEGVVVTSSHTVDDVGDEAKMYKIRFPNQDVLLGKDRISSIKEAHRRNNSVVILDDGLQSSNIHKDLSIMLINPSHPFYYLRHFRFLRSGAGPVLVHDEDCDGSGPGCYSFEIDGFFDLNGDVIEPGNGSLYGFSAVGDNRRFQRDLQRFNLKKFLGFRDHHRFTADDIQSLDRERREEKIDWLVCTEKDFMKIIGMKIPHIPLIYVRNRIKCDHSFLQRLNFDEAKKNYTETSV